MRKTSTLFALLAATALPLAPASAQNFFFSTGNPLTTMATASRPSSAGKIEIESADDFITGATTTFINQATFTGLLTGTSPTVGEVRVEIYRVFPKDSTNPPSGNVPTRVNSPSDVAFDDRDTVGSTLSFTTATLATTFTANNSILNGINKIPNQTTGGEGAVTGTEVLFTATFATPFALPADHYFIVPQVEVTTAGGEFYWLAGQRPAVTPIAPDLQSWIRNANLDPDWLRIGTDVVGGTPAPTFNGAFSLVGAAVPEPGSLAMLAGLGVPGLALVVRRRRCAR